MAHSTTLHSKSDVTPKDPENNYANPLDVLKPRSKDEKELREFVKSLQRLCAAPLRGEKLWETFADSLNAVVRPKGGLSVKVEDNKKEVVRLFKALTTNAGSYRLHDSGLTPVITEIFHDLRNHQQKEVVWIEMEDFTDVPALMHYVLHIISLRRGIFQLEHAVLLPGRFTDRRRGIDFTSDSGIGKDLWAEIIKTACSYLGVDLRQYVFCFYGRNVPGSCAGWGSTGRKWEANDYSELHLVLGLLSKKGMNVLYVPLTPERIEQNDGVDQKITGKVGELLPGYTGNCDLKIGRQCADKNICSIPGNFYYLATRTLEARRGNAEPLSMVDALNKLSNDIAAEEMALASANSKRETSEDISSQVKLLYTVSLFRCSRPPSAFLTDPVFTSPYQFNAHGVDSDWAKKQDVDQWLENYRELQLMWRKPGGNSWMYRDGLLGLRLVLERGHSKYSSGEPKGKWSQILGGRRPQLITTKARTHFYIARWYYRAFCSSNHAVPLLESLHHFYQCVISLPAATPPGNSEALVDENLYRQQRLVRALTEWIKVLRLGQQTLLFWFDRPAIEGWLAEPIRSNLIGKVVEVRDECWKDKNEKQYFYAKFLTEELQRELERCHLAFQRELSLPPEVISVSREKREMLIASAKIEKIHLFAKNPDWLPANNCAESAMAEGESMAHSILKELLQHPEELPGSTNSVGPNHFISVKETAFKALQHCDNLTPRLPVALTILRDRLYMLVRDAKAMDFEAILGLSEKSAFPVGNLIPAHSRESRARWKLVTLLGRTMFDLCAFLPPDLLVFDMNLRATVQTLHALALGRLGRFYQAHRRLNEAHALLTRVPARPGDGPDFAIVELRRAEVYLLEADQVGALLKLAMQKHATSFRDSLDTLIKREVQNKEGALPNEEQQAVIPLKRQLLDIYDLKDSELLVAWANRSSKDESGDFQRFEDYFKEELVKVDSAASTSEETAELTRHVADLWRQATNGLKARDQWEGEHSVEEIFQYSLRDKIQKILVAKLDDAWSSIETAEHLLSGQIRTSLSWGRLCNLKLRLFAHHKAKDIKGWELLAQHRRHDLSTELSRWLRLGFANWPDDPFRQMRLAWYFLKAKSNWSDRDGLPSAKAKLFPQGMVQDSRDFQDIELISGMAENWEHGQNPDNITRITKCRGALYELIGGCCQPTVKEERSMIVEKLQKLARPFPPMK